jgi:UDP-sugar transporter A1/2/3
LLTNKSRSRDSFFESWTPSTLVPIVLKAFGGLLTAFVHKHAGSVTKGFALILGLVLTGVIQAILDKKMLSRDQMVGTGLVLLSSWLHFTNPPGE